MNQDSGIREVFTPGIWAPELWNPEFSSRNPESKFHWQVIRNPVPKIWNLHDGIQNPGLSWITFTLHRRDNTSMRNEIIRSKTLNLFLKYSFYVIYRTAFTSVYYTRYLLAYICSRYTKELFVPTRKAMRYIIMNTYPICDSPVPLRSFTKIAPAEINVFICVQKPPSVWF